MFLTLLLACASEPAPPPAPPAPPPAAVPEAPPPASGGDEALQARVQAAAVAFGPALRGRLMEAVKAGGPPEGVEVCSVEAPAIAARVAAEHNVRIGRTSLKLRNPANVGPDWVMARLRSGDTSPLREVVDVDGARVARMATPIVIEEPCLACHGDPAGFSAEVTAALAASYPQDAATGYALGDVRGMLWIEGQ